MTTWIEAPPQPKGMGCFAKGCLILVVFVILLGVAFVAGSYWAVRQLQGSYFPSSPISMPAVTATDQQVAEVKARWDAFEAAARSHQKARIELSAADLNALLASEPDLRGRAAISIENDLARVQRSVPLSGIFWLKGRYLNGQCTIQASPDQRPSEAKITSLIVNNQPVPDEWLDRRWFTWPSIRTLIADWSNDEDLAVFDIRDDKVILETRGGG